jgi:hypothetical protein
VVSTVVVAIVLNFNPQKHYSIQALW